QEQIEEVHDQFKSFVKRHRPALDIDRVATGEHWLGERAVELGLTNRVMTSDDYLLSKIASANVYHVHFQRHRGIRERFVATAALSAQGIIDAVVDRFRALPSA